MTLEELKEQLDQNIVSLDSDINSLQDSLAELDKKLDDNIASSELKINKLQEIIDSLDKKINPEKVDLTENFTSEQKDVIENINIKISLRPNDKVLKEYLKDTIKYFSEINHVNK